MKILAMGKSVFDKLMFEKGITWSNVEQQDKLLFISINNNGGIVTEGDIPFFPKDKKNVKVMYFSDVEKDQIIPLIGVKGEFLALAMTKEQAADLFAFIKDNIKGKEAVLIHCTAGVSRSGAVASFIFDYLSTVEWGTFIKDNPQIQPNAHVYRLLHDEWYKDLEFPAGWTEEDEHRHNCDLKKIADECVNAINNTPGLFKDQKAYLKPEYVAGIDPYNDNDNDNFKTEVMNPIPQEQQIALYNNEHPDQHTTLEYLTKEEIKEKYDIKDKGMVMTSKYCDDTRHYGIDGQYFKLPLSKRFNIGDNLWNGFKDCPILHIINEPIIEEVEYSENGECKYCTHTVVIREIKMGYFYPRKFLLPGTIFHKV